MPRSIASVRRLFLLVAAVVLVDTSFYAAISPLLPEYADKLDLSKTAAGVLTASYAAGTLVGSLPGGWLAARAGVKPTLLLGLALLGRRASRSAWRRAWCCSTWRVSCRAWAAPARGRPAWLGS
jgi:predicted MFS family arabinose efflux permease